MFGFFCKIYQLINQLIDILDDMLLDKRNFPSKTIMRSCLIVQNTTLYMLYYYALCDFRKKKCMT